MRINDFRSISFENVLLRQWKVIGREFEIRREI